MREDTQARATIDVNAINSVIKSIFNIQSLTTGGPNHGYQLRYAGELLIDSEKAYDQLDRMLEPMGLTPLFRIQNNEQVILIVEKRPEPKIGPVWVNIALFFLTLLSVMFTGAQFVDTDVVQPFQLPFMEFLAYLGKGWPFALSLLGILLAHELGHYFVGKSYGEKVTLPYFIPFPLSAFGTMGAFISMKEIPRNKKHLMDIGIAGPLAGLIVAIPVLLIGLSLSTIGPIETNLPEGYVNFLEGNSLFYLGAKYLTFGELMPQPASYEGIAPFLYWLRYFFTGSPVPLGGMDVQIHVVAWAGWAGLFVTAINLIPAGQLDGGHILYVLLGKKKAKKLFPLILIILFGLGFFWQGWWIWAVMIFLVGRRYAEPLDQITTVDKKRRILGVLALIVFVLTFTPVPLIIF